ncbi:putative P-type Ca(2+) transporter [Helianthus annuus]|uniref:Calcium-transporting ATPase n=1 Tax=Helianthus annuus TaxID=4232 RepID=A0A251T4H1_HELAN|nr:putative calcium-transporting ATPase 7, plasma membrane-type [Helianthus annuus]KAF5791582.1 putative calcium-transporting ATPase [Helianthus annuus]KAJ0535129.1 putative P-type Ca(2+) transporter [Helianthus annuus]KAJ0889003.1 putative P-type Ca(2+) transporter [Helianthus annuus]KAJ0893829.1 putative calcium-transporting ATPase [Helianthus annuus]
MEDYLNIEKSGEMNPKHSSKVLQKWRDMCERVKNPKRRFRLTANDQKHHEAAAMPSTNQKLRVAVLVSKVAFHLLNGVEASSHMMVPEEFKASGFGISADDAGSIVEGRNPEKLTLHGGIEGLAAKLKTCTTNGIAMDDDKDLTCRQKLFGTNELFTEREQRSFWVFVFEALQDMTIMVLTVCALVGIATEGWPTGAHDGLGLVASILLVVFVTATSDYRRQSLQFRNLDKEKKSIQVTRNGYRQKLSIYELLPGDIVHLAIGDQVPADGLFLSGFGVLVDDSSSTRESELVEVNTKNRYLLSGSKVKDGSCKMLVVAVGMRTQRGKLMAALTEGGIDETSLQVKLKRVATIIGKIGIVFALVKFAVRS